ncbi:MAG: FAD-dependent oxidoreductase [Ginsengibacter sp.]
MRKASINTFIFLLLFLNSSLQAQTIQKSYDVVVYGGTSAGVIAAYTAKKMGKSVILVEPGFRLGGLTSGGLGQTDIGNKYAVTGISLDFYRRIGKHYGKLEQWTFEPHVAQQIFDDYIKSAGVTLMYSRRLVSVKTDKGYIKEIVVENSVKPGKSSYTSIKAKMYIDCTYEGDLMARSGVSYTVGRESNSTCNETYNGVQLRDKHQFPDGIDPYKTPGVPETGLLWGISDGKLEPTGTGDKKVQTYNIRVCLTNNPVNRISISKPDNYDPDRYLLLLRLLEKRPVAGIRELMTTSKMPGDKTDINNNGAFSTDMIGWSYEYPEAGYDKRREIKKAHDDYTKGLFYFIGHDPRMPAVLRKDMLQWGYPKDEYPENNHWTPQMYVREARRMIGEYVMTQANCEGKEVVKDGVGLAAYTMDSHNCQRIVMNGMVKNEGDVQIGGFDPYPISYRALIPKANECKNLLVPVCLSASHIAYGSIRMEPVFMVLGQSSAAAASQAIDKDISVQEVNTDELRHELISNPYADGSAADIILDNEDAAGIELNGLWVLEKRGGYGPTFLADTSSSHPPAFARFTPEIIKGGNYEIYTYYPKLENGASITPITVFDGKQKIEKTIDKSKIEVIGQTSGEWVSLGKYKLSKGKNAYVEISNKNVDGVVVADAVLFVKEK